MQGIPGKDALAYLAETYEMNENTVRGIVNRKLPTEAKDTPGFTTYATSTLYRGKKGEGEAAEVVLQWVKESRDKSREAAEEMIKALAEDLPKVKPAKADKKLYRDDVIAVYPLGDPHMGMMAWNAETGDNFDLQIAERNLCSAVARLVDTVPDCDEALIVNLGDYFHSDNAENRTARSGHSLDVDGRWVKVLRVGVKAMRQCIESALQKHKHVTVINAIGNHDDHSSMFLSVALANIYENEPRVTINDSPTALHFHEFGRNMIAVHHGHGIKADRLPLVIAAEQPEMWGRTKNRYALVGHIHHDTVKEYNGIKIESFRTLAGRDAWHAAQGYRSGKDMKSLLIHRHWGEIERHVVSVEMLESTLELAE